MRTGWKIAALAALLGWALWISWPKFGDLERVGVEGFAKGALGERRVKIAEQTKALGRPPATIAGLPVLWKTRILREPHAPTSSVVIASTAAARDTGGWGYDPGTGWLFIDCTHLDSRLRVWTEY